MNTEVTNYSKTITVSANTKKTFAALTENLHAWWGDISKASFKPDGQFRVQFENGYWWDFKITEYLPNYKLTWLCIGGEPEFNKEWIGNTLYWEIKEQKTNTTIIFLHRGLTPKAHCYDICAPTWDRFITQELKTFLD